MSSVDLLFHSRLPALNEYLSESSQSILWEVSFWVTVYLIYTHLMSRVVRFTLSKYDFWQSAKHIGGGFCANGQDDAVLLSTLFIHHLTAGIICAYGVYTSNPTLWRHGYLLEIGYEGGDLLAVILNMYPYRLDNVKPGITAGFVFHHIPGILFPVVFLNAGLHHNIHLQLIAVWLLAGAACTCFTAVVCYTFEFGNSMGPGVTVDIAHFYLDILAVLPVLHLPHRIFSTVRRRQGEPKIGWLRDYYVPVHLRHLLGRLQHSCCFGPLFQNHSSLAANVLWSNKH
jgi:hypothetical protein